MTDAVSDFGAKLLSGEETSPEAWQRHLREVHGRLPGATSAFASRHATAAGRTSYELLADSAVSAARELDRPVDVLDLACGDGYLIEVCFRELGGRVGTITGVDMSEAELELARRRLAGADARLYTGLAQSLPLAPDSVDVALCHAAFMLMVPVEPVVQQLARVLRPGGIFSAVVGSTSSASESRDEDVEGRRALWTGLREALREFWQTEYPRLRPDGRVGDPRAMSRDGWRELFGPQTGFTGDVDLQELEIIVRESPEGIWSFFETTYLVDLLDDEKRATLRSRLLAVVGEHERAHGTVAMAFPLQLLSVRSV